MPMTIDEACRQLHFMLGTSTPLEQWPSDGMYFFVEAGEPSAHGHGIADRITRSGSHNSQGRLHARAMEHMRQNSNGSAVVKHVGSALARRKAPSTLCAHWGHRESRGCVKCQRLVVDARDYLTKSVRIHIVGVEKDWRKAEDVAIGILAHCTICKRSPQWLGQFATNSRIGAGRLWNDRGINYIPTMLEIEWLFTVMRGPWIVA